MDDDQQEMEEMLCQQAIDASAENKIKATIMRDLATYITRTSHIESFEARRDAQIQIFQGISASLGLLLFCTVPDEVLWNKILETTKKAALDAARDVMKNFLEQGRSPR